jgi:4-amino-4-deoxy-L-arabinose transferase-like glycosyltransferase
VTLLGLLAVGVTGILAARLAGSAAGLAATFAAALSPDLVAHSGLATLDLPVAAFLALAALLAWRWTEHGSLRDAVGYAIAISAACMTKSTALHFLVALPIGAALIFPAPTLARLSRAAVLAAAGGAATLALAWVLYGPGPVDGLLPTAYARGLAGKALHASLGHFSYLLGERSRDGFPHYFLVAYAVKTPLAILVAAVLGAVRLATSRFASRAGFVAFVLFPAAWILVALSLVHRVHVGIRHALPAHPAMLALAGLGVAWLASRGAAGRFGAAGLAVWAIVAAARITPDHLAYFNEAAGGPDRGDRILIDSNLDWGQDEGRFRRWAAGRSVAVNPDLPVDGHVAANVNALRGILSWDDLRLRWLRRTDLEASFGHSFRVYRASEAPLRAAAGREALAALDYAWWLVGVGRPADAESVLAALEDPAVRDDPVHAKGDWRVRGEAALARGRFAEAADAAERAGDGDLAIEVEHRRRTASGGRPDATQAARAIRALARRGHREEASRLGLAVFGRDPLEPPPADGPPPRWTEAGRLKALGAEREALGVLGRALAEDPRNEDALWMYGEIVVRRKLGLTEFEWPEVDWSRVRRSSR